MTRPCTIPVWVVPFGTWSVGQAFREGLPACCMLSWVGSPRSTGRTSCIVRDRAGCPWWTGRAWFLAIRARMRWRVLSLCSRCGTLGRSFSRSRPQSLVRSLERRVWLWTFRLPSAWKRSVSRWFFLLSGHWTSWPACRRCASAGYPSPSGWRCSNRPTAVTFARPCSCWGFWQADPPPRTLCALGLRWRRRKPGECQSVVHPSGQNLLLSTLMASSVWQCEEVDWRGGLSGRGRRWGTVCAVRQDIQYPCCSDCVLCWLEWLQTVVRRF